MPYIAGREMDLTDTAALEAALLEAYQEDALNPKWAEFDARRKHVQEWQTYVTPELRALWDHLDLKTRVAIIHVCETAASNEDWD